MSPPPTSRRTVLRTLGLAGAGAVGAGSLTAAALAIKDDGVSPDDGTTRNDVATQDTGATTDDGAASPPPGAATWPSYHDGVGNRGFNTESGGLTAPLSRGETRLTGGACGPIVGPQHVFLAQDRGTVVAVDRAAGETSWITDLEGEVAQHRDETVLALADELVLATVGSAIHALDVADGTVQWRTEVDGNETAGSTVADGIVYCLTDHGVLVALDLATGSPVWRFEAGFGETHIYDDARNTPALSPDGSTLWEFTADAGPITVPTAADGALYAGTGSGHLHVVDPATGEVRETRDAFHGLHGRPAISGDTVGVPSDEGHVYGFSTGE